jgi:hypothetical protein
VWKPLAIKDQRCGMVIGSLQIAGQCRFAACIDDFFSDKPLCASLALALNH